MNKTAATVALIGLFGMSAVPLGAQSRRNSQGIPPGQMPPAGQCRVWYEGVPPGRQPRATSCREAERVASRDRNARVIYGANTDRQNGGWWDPDYRNDRAIPRSTPYPYPDRYPSNRYPNSRGTYRYSSVAFDNGYNDGLDKGREDGRDRDSYDPNRHSRYRSADHGYDKRYGSKDEYKQVYREGFRAGYNDAYRQTNTRRGSSSNFPWPF